MKSRWIGLPAVVLALCLAPLCGGPAQAETPADLIGKKLTATDTLNIGDEPNDDARECLQGLTWATGNFEVELLAPAGKDREDLLIRFPSPQSTTDNSSKNVYMEWFAVKDEQGSIVPAPAVVVVHESGRKMPVGRMFAAGFRQRGVHAFMVQLPEYGSRRSPKPDLSANRLGTIRQGITDVRRARDAVVALPFISSEKISLQGTSLGGFICSTTAGIDGGYDNIFLMLSGGDVYSVLQNGDRDAAKFRQEVAAAGVDDAMLRKLTYEIEPNRLARRLDPQRTWLYSGVFDTVVPIENARSFAQAAQLESSHHTLMPVDHFAGILFLPAILDQMANRIKESAQASAQAR